MDWSPQSPDPTENLWVGKDFTQWTDSHHQYKSLGEKIVQLWVELNAVTLHKFT